MANGTHPGFDPEKVNQALQAAHQYAEPLRSKATATHEASLTEGVLNISGGCISVTVKDGKVCVNLPLGIGSVCLPVPSWIPSGTAAQACLNICTTFGIPCGVEVTVTVAGVQIVKQGFGCGC